MRKNSSSSKTFFASAISLEQATALAAVAAFLVSVAVAVNLNPSFRFGTDYLSKLGTAGDSAAWFNYGMLATAFFLAAFSASIYLKLGRSIASVVGLASGIAASLALATVGLLPQETGRPHVIASFLFFVLLGFSSSSLALEYYSRRARLPALIGMATQVLVSVFFALGGAVLQAVTITFFAAWILLSAFTPVSKRVA